MARLPRGERRPANLLCNSCGYQFVRRVWYAAIESDGEIIEWVPDRGGARGNTCPSCGSELIGFHRD
jgi:predicted RNA-binding Zn-ribbon protein involved in translation (DUF1610 family)